jgi:hypothetical protein
MSTSQNAQAAASAGKGAGPAAQLEHGYGGSGSPSFDQAIERRPFDRAPGVLASADPVAGACGDGR